MKQSGGVQDRQLLLALEEESRRRQQHQKRLRALSLIGAASMLVPGAASQLLPVPKRLDCPKCRRAQLQRSATMSYCLRCAYTVKA